METHESIGLLISLGESTSRSWEIYYLVVFAILGFVSANREIIHSQKLKLIIATAFLVFSVYSGLTLKTFQDRKIRMWEFATQTVECPNNYSCEIASLLADLEPNSPYMKMSVQFGLDVLVLTGIWLIPLIRRES